MMKPVELSVIRTKLRAVNVEYSALVRAHETEHRSTRMNELRAERRVLMALMAGERAIVTNPLHVSSRQQPFNSAMQAAG